MLGLDLLAALDGRALGELLLGSEPQLLRQLQLDAAQLLRALLDPQGHPRVLGALLELDLRRRRLWSLPPPPPPPLALVQSTVAGTACWEVAPENEANATSKTGAGGWQRSRVAKLTPFGPPANVSVNSEIGMSGRPLNVTTFRASAVSATAPLSFSPSAPRRSRPISGRPPPAPTSTTGPVSACD